MPILQSLTIFRGNRYIQMNYYGGEEVLYGFLYQAKIVDCIFLMIMEVLRYCVKYLKKINNTIFFLFNTRFMKVVLGVHKVHWYTLEILFNSYVFLFIYFGEYITLTIMFPTQWRGW